jgi:hypothetical protein
LGRWSPSTLFICDLEMNAWTNPERVNPSTRAQKVSKNIHQPSRKPLYIFPMEGLYNLHSVDEFILLQVSQMQATEVLIQSERLDLHHICARDLITLYEEPKRSSAERVSMGFQIPQEWWRSVWAL